MKQGPSLPLPPKRQPSAQPRAPRKSPSKSAISSKAFEEMIYRYGQRRCFFCEVPLVSPEERAQEGDRPRFLLRDPSQEDFPEGWMIACPCCALEKDRRYLAEALLEGKAGVFAWAHPGEDHPRPIELSATVRAMVAWMDRVSSAYPQANLPNPRQAILDAFRSEGYGIVGAWDAHPNLTSELRSLAHRMNLADLPPPGSRYVPGETKGRNTAWVSSHWARILADHPGAWERNQRYVLVLPWPEIARNQGFDLDAFTHRTLQSIESDHDRFHYTQQELGDPASIQRRIAGLRG